MGFSPGPSLKRRSQQKHRHRHRSDPIHHFSELVRRLLILQHHRGGRIIEFDWLTHAATSSKDDYIRPIIVCGPYFVNGIMQQIVLRQHENK